MIRVTVELLSARTDRTTTLGVGYISNVTGTTEHVLNKGRLGNYHVQLSGKGGARDDHGRIKKVWREAAIHGYPRASLVFWHLIARCLSAACAAPVPATSRRPGHAVQSDDATE